jgi:hypothetical protein
MMQEEKIKALVAEYQEDFKETGPDLVRLDLLGKGYSEQEADQVIEALTKEPEKDSKEKNAKGQTAPKQSTKAIAEQSPNDEIKPKLAKIDYENLHGESFAEYGELVESLPADKMFDFVVVKVEAIKQTRFEGVDGSPIDTIGVKLTSTIPVSATRVYAKTAIAQNGRIYRGRTYFTVEGQQFHQNRLFYLLKK